MQPDVDIVIAGAGPAGSSTALFLVQRCPALRARILVLDKARFPRDKICAGAIGGRADRLLASIGVRAQVPSAWVWGLRAETRHGDIERRAAAPIGRVVRRRAFDAALTAAMQERGVALRQGVRLLRFERRADRVVLHTSEGTLTARALVGADGVGSVVRRGLGLPQRQIYAQAVEVDTPWLPGDAARDLLSFALLDPATAAGRALGAGYAWDFPTVCGGRSLVCRGLYRITRGLADVEEPAPRALPDLGELLLARLRARGLPAERLQLRRFAERGLPLHAPAGGERVLLVGDAAGIDPVLGEGIAQAIFYGEAAARYLEGCHARADFRFGDYRAWLGRQRIGLDLRIRAWGLPQVYGRRRARLERWVSASPALVDAGMAYFAGERVPRVALGRAALDLLAALGDALGGSRGPSGAGAQLA